MVWTNHTTKVKGTIINNLCLIFIKLKEAIMHPKCDVKKRMSRVLTRMKREIRVFLRVISIAVIEDPMRSPFPQHHANPTPC